MTPPRHVRYNPSADYYRILNVSPGASIDEIRQAFRQRAKEVHPDAVPPAKRAWANRQFQQINEAHDFLTDPALRESYDKQRYFYLSQAFNKTTKQAKRNWFKYPRSTVLAGFRQKHPRIFWVLAVIYVLGIVAIAVANQASSHDTDTTRYLPTMDYAGLFATYAASSVPPIDHAACTDPEMQIVEPVDGETLSKPFSVRGTVSGIEFVSFHVEAQYLYQDSSAADQAAVLFSWYGKTMIDPVVDGSLIDPSTLDSLPNGDYRLRLVVIQKSGLPRQCDVRVTLKD